MGDVLFLGLILGFFVVAAGYAALCEHVREQRP